jgi:hypothetical protein
VIFNLKLSLSTPACTGFDHLLKFAFFSLLSQRADGWAEEEN